MFFDWLTMYQDHDCQLPVLGDQLTVTIDTITGERLAERQPSITHEGSFSTSIQVRISGNRVTVSGNPSRFDRLDNLFGFESLDSCVRVYNRVLLELGLPPFTKCTRVFLMQGEDGERVGRCSDGAVITELHITSNRAVGQGNEREYIKAISTQRYRNSIPRLHTNGRTCDWLSARGNASLIYPSAYDKAHELNLHHMPKVLRKFGEGSPEHLAFKQVISFCANSGVVRFEQKLKAAFLRRHNFRFWGLFDERQLAPWHDEFLALDQRLQVTAMNFETIADRLQRLGICDSTRAANTTAVYALQWMSGHAFDLSKTQVQTHRARLRKIGIDIAEACDMSKHAPIQIRQAKDIVVSDLVVPDWYQLPQVPALRLVA